MIENVMNHIGGVGVFGVISISLFFVFFTGTLVWASRLKKKYLQSMQALPLDDAFPDSTADNSVRSEPESCGANCKCADKAVRASLST
jgi:hypothetical protein